MTTEDEFAHDEHKAGDEGEWVSNEPPVDDFGDAASHEAATVSEGEDQDQLHAHDHEEERAEADPVVVKKKTPVGMIAGGLVVLIALGGGGYWFYSNHMVPQANLLDAEAQRNVAPPVFNAQPPAQQADKTPPSDVAPTTGFSPPSAIPAAPAASAAAATPTAPDNAPEPSMAMSGIVNKPAIQTPPTATATAQPAGVDDQRLVALSTRLDDLQKSMGQTTQQLQQISDKLTTTGSSGDAGGKSDAQTDERINRLEQKITQLEETRSSSSSSHSYASATSNEDHVSTRSSSRHMRHAHKTSAKTKTKATPNPWVLRAATSNEAWIGKSDETRELRPVHVGDSLEGIGKVTAIRQVGDTWVVQGAHGTIR